MLSKFVTWIDMCGPRPLILTTGHLFAPAAGDMPLAAIAFGNSPARSDWFRE
jgi:hypothetical protein